MTLTSEGQRRVASRQRARCARTNGPDRRTCPIFALPIILLCLSYVPGCKQSLDEPFDENKWRHGDPEARGGMVCDLLSISKGEWRKSMNLLRPAGRLTGLTRTEVVKLLGKPDYTYNSGGSYGPNADFTSEIGYNVGYLNETGYLQELFAMMVGFNDEDVVSVVLISD